MHGFTVDSLLIALGGRDKRFKILLASRRGDDDIDMSLDFSRLSTLSYIIDNLGTKPKRINLIIWIKSAWQYYIYIIQHILNYS